MTGHAYSTHPLSLAVRPQPDAYGEPVAFHRHSEEIGIHLAIHVFVVKKIHRVDPVRQLLEDGGCAQRLGVDLSLPVFNPL